MSQIQQRFPKSIILLGGDFNCPGIEWLSVTLTDPYVPKCFRESLIMFSQECLLDQIVLQPTRGNNILDLCFVSHPDYVLKYEVVPGFSDHDAVIVNILNCITVSEHPKNEILCYRQANWLLIRDSLVNISNTYFRNNEITSKSVEENWSFFRDSILKTIKDFIPVKSPPLNVVSHGCQTN